MSHEQKQLGLCRACMQFVKPEEDDCPFCGANLAEAALEYQIKLYEAQQAARDLEKLLAEMGLDPDDAYRAFKRTA